MFDCFRVGAALLLLAISGFVSAFNMPPNASATPRITNRKANTNGRVPIVMYHNFDSDESPYTRSYSHFRKDLETFYKLGFRPVTMTQYLTNKMPIPPGATPIVITMDDSSPTQLHLDAKGHLDPLCGVGIWKEFAAKHPDFPVKGTFYVLPIDMWLQPEWVHTKVRMLKALGSELACHTWDHPSLRHLSDDKVKAEIGRSVTYLKSLGFTSPSLAFPYGIYPKHLKLLNNFEWHGNTFSLPAAVTCNPTLSPPPDRIGKERFTLPRIEAKRGYLALDYWLPLFAKGKGHLYVAP